MISNIFTFVGQISIFQYVYALFTSLYTSVFRSSKRPRDFGKWAIVTGATDGIGKAIAIELYKHGLNLMIIGRNKEKLSNTALEMRNLQIHPESEIKEVIMDFSDPSGYDQLNEKIRELDDIGILVNNAGVGYPYPQYFDELDVNFINEIIDVNIKGVFMMTKMVYGKMKEQKRGAILCIGSGFSELTSVPLYSIYASSKKAVQNFCNNLQVESSAYNIVVQCQTLLIVMTKMSKMKKESLFVIPPQKMAEESIKELCKGGLIWSTTCPYWAHKLQLIFANLIPTFIWNNLILWKLRSIRDRALKKK
ncbi:oxidoreductase, short chain dehydrogenase/reductase family protein [Cryptosporidium serpentis]